MLETIISFAVMVIITWSLTYGCLWVLEKIALLTGSDFFRISTYSWVSSWKSWAFTAVMVLIFYFI